MKTIKHLFGTVGLLLLLLMGTVGGARATVTTLSLPDSHVVFSGAVVNGGGYIRSGSTGTVIDFQFTGTALTGTFYAGSNTVSIDGAAATTLTQPNADTVQTLATGLAEATHSVHLVLAVNNFIKLVGFTVTGAAPALALPADAGLAGTQYLPTNAAGTAAAAGFRLDGAMKPTNLSDGGPVANGFFLDGSLSFRATATRLRGYFLGNSNGRYKLVIDGVEQAALISDPASWGWVDIGGGTSGITLDGSAEHEYQLLNVHESNFTQNNIQAIMSIGGTVNTSYSFVARKTLLAVGDSITHATYQSPNHSDIGYLHNASLGLNYGAVNEGGDGQKVSDIKNRIGTIDGLTTAPNYITLLIGTNDIAVATAAGNATTAGTFIGDYTSVLNSMLAAYPSAKIKAVGIFNRTDNGTYTALVPTYNGYIQTAVAACTAPARVQYVDTSGWNLLAGDLADGLHPTSAGYAAKITPRIKALFAALLFRSRPSGHRAGSRSPL